MKQFQDMKDIKNARQTAHRAYQRYQLQLQQSQQELILFSRMNQRILNLYQTALNAKV